MLVTLKEILSETIDKKYAVGGFGAFDYAYGNMILETAEEVGKPIILMIPGFIYDKPDYERILRFFSDRIRSLSVPVAMHLDHGKSIEECMMSIRYGCSSIMYDGSSLPMEENIANTNEIVRAAHACGVSVEAEIGHVSGHEGNMLEGNEVDTSKFTTVEEAKTFAEATDVDALAIAVGTVHGVYKGEPKLDFERIKAIRAAIKTPLVLHGGSGLTDEMFRDAIQCGISKINFCTSVGLAGGNAAREYVKEREGHNISLELMLPDVLNASKEEIKKRIEVFGTQELSK